MPLEIVFLEPQNWRPLKPITRALLPPSRGKEKKMAESSAESELYNMRSRRAIRLEEISG